MRVLIIGYGHMGHEVENILRTRGHECVAVVDKDEDWERVPSSVDVAIDFSTSESLFRNVSQCLDRSIAMVIGTTGWHADHDALRALISQSGAALIHSSNYSIGMQLFQRIVRQAAHLINDAQAYDIMLHEIHHKHKTDSPSGTALSLANIILHEVERKKQIESNSVQGAIYSGALHVSSTRVGEVAGTHTVMMDSFADTIELIHRAKNRSGFALGSVLAAEWLIGKTGFFEFSEEFEQILSHSRV